MKLLAISIIFGPSAVLLLCIEIGFRLGRWHRARFPTVNLVVTTTMEASVFGLMGLLVAFSFSGAGSRFDTRRSLVATEANAIGTAYLRLDLLPPAKQPQLRNDFREYVRSRLLVSQTASDTNAMNAALAKSRLIQMRIWIETAEALKDIGPAERTLLVSALNEMIDVTTTRSLAALSHPPVAVFIMLGLTVVASSALAGYSMALSGSRNWVFVLAFACIVGTAMYVILDYENPRIGLVRIDRFDAVLAQTLEQMK
jgi:hypothetical protein